ncbi:hypothetical protein Tco_0864289 [Tanacetum coccineum]
MFDEYFNPPPIYVSPVQEAATPRAKVLADSHVSTSIDQDAPSIIFINHKQEEAINFKESFTSVARIEAIVFLRSLMPLKRIMTIYKMDVKSAFLMASLKKRSSFSNRGFVDQDNPIRKCTNLQGNRCATLYRVMIGSLMYLTSSRPDLNYVVCLCTRYQAKPTEKHLQAVKRIFRYLNRTIHMGLWYSKDTPKLSLISIMQIDDLSGGCQGHLDVVHQEEPQFLGDKLVSWSSKKQKSTV